MVSATSMSMQVNLFVSGRKLKDLDTFSKSDPQCRLYEKRNNQWHMIGKTECINNNLNPDFTTSFTVAYFFEKVQHFKFEMVDLDNGDNYDVIGAVEVTMGNLMGAKRQTWTGQLSAAGAANRGSLIVRTQAIEQSNYVAKWALNWQNVRNMGGGCMGMCAERFYYRCRIMQEVPGQDHFTTVTTVNTQYNTQGARMTQQTIPLGNLCNNNKSARIKFALFSANNHEFHSAITTIADLEAGKTTLDCGNDCTLVFDNFEIKEKKTFVDYLRSGWEVSLTVAVDYTASNGEIRDPRSLHAMGPTNQYESAIFNVGPIVEPYDHDRQFPVFGFGGIPRHMGINSVNHCFAMNGNPAVPELPGIQSIIDTYRQTLPQIGLAGPTLFGPLLEEFKNMMISKQGQPQYQILLLLTDGAIHDMPRTIDLVCELAEMPCSIIIVGVGNADFSLMEQLDGDEVGLRNSRGQLCARDIVQFVEFNQSVARGDLAEQVLKEVPEQVCGFMERSGFVAVAQQQTLASASTMQSSAQ